MSEDHERRLRLVDAGTRNRGLDDRAHGTSSAESDETAVIMRVPMPSDEGPLPDDAA